MDMTWIIGKIAFMVFDGSNNGAGTESLAVFLLRHTIRERATHKIIRIKNNCWWHALPSMVGRIDRLSHDET
jgi:hypothetical protein